MFCIFIVKLIFILLPFALHYNSNECILVETDNNNNTQKERFQNDVNEKRWTFFCAVSQNVKSSGEAIIAIFVDWICYARMNLSIWRYRTLIRLNACFALFNIQFLSQARISHGFFCVTSWQGTCLSYFKKCLLLKFNI